MTTINRNKIPPQKVFGKPNVWSVVAVSHQDSPMADLNWDEMEGLFCLQQTKGSPKLGRENSGNPDTLERLSRKENEIILLVEKRSLNVNIFLKQSAPRKRILSSSSGMAARGHRGGKSFGTLWYQIWPRSKHPV